MDISLFKIKDFIKRWGFLIVLCFVAISTVLMSVNSVNKTQLQVGDVSPKTYKATKDVENTIATERNQELAKAEVQTIYSVDETKNQEINSHKDSFFKEIDLTRSIYNADLQKLEDSNSSNTTAYRGTTTTEEDIISEQVDEIIKELENLELDITKIARSDLEYILTMDNEDYTIFKNIIDKSVSQITTDGLTSSQYEEGDFYTGEDNNVSIYETMLVNNIISLITEPNVTVDVDATQAAIDAAVADVSPVMYLKNQTIVSDGDIITDEQLAVLVKLNLTGTVKEFSFFNICGYVIIIIMEYITIGLVFNKKENEKFFAKNYKYLFFTLNIIMLLCIFFTPKEYSLISPIFIIIFILSTLYNNFIACIVSVVYIILYVLTDGIIPLEGMFLLITTAFISAIVTKNIERFRVVKISLIISLISSLIYFFMYNLYSSNSGEFLSVFASSIIMFGFILVSIIFAIGVLPFFEITFGILTDHTLEDLINQERPIFKKMLAETPGTFHHSIVVANLSEAGAKAIGANAKLAKAYGYYHDIGKLSAPMYFIENQVGYNYHDDLDCIESAKVIKNHVDYGLELRKEYKLPKFIDNAILSHHGTSVIQFFYRRALEDEAIKEVDIQDFTYKGFIPDSKELSILMLADIVEAGVRSIVPKAKSMEEVDSFIDKIIDGKSKEGQFNNSELTYREMQEVKNAFMVILKGMYHNRITYPSQK